VLYGANELTPLDTVTVAGFEVPRVVIMLLLVTLINLLFVVLFFKELRLTSFDPAMASTLGMGTQWLHYALMVLVAATAVASFESVGNILVVAMFVVPAATARLLTDSLAAMVALSVIIAAAAGGAAGWWVAAALPESSSGAVLMSGVLSALTAVVAVALVILATDRRALAIVLRK
jgi:manganese/zinc/iron transport system permease protein